MRDSSFHYSRLFYRSRLMKIHVHGQLFHRWHYAIDQNSSVLNQSFPHAAVETWGHRFYDVAESVLSHSNFGVPDICRLRTIYDGQIERPCVLPRWIGFSAVGATHNLWCSSSPDWQTTVSYFGLTFAELYDCAIFFLSYQAEVLSLNIATV